MRRACAPTLTALSCLGRIPATATAHIPQCAHEDVCLGLPLTESAQAKLLREAAEFITIFAKETAQGNSWRERRLVAMAAAVHATGTYELSHDELEYGAQLSWRNAPKCANRAKWQELKILDYRSVERNEDAFEALLDMVDTGLTSSGTVTRMAFFRARRAGEVQGPTIWNEMLFRFAGYEQADGSAWLSAEALGNADASLAPMQTPFAVLGLGSTAYPRFCKAADTVFHELVSAGAKPLLAVPAKMDALKDGEQVFQGWLDSIFSAFASDAQDSNNAASQESDKCSLVEPEPVESPAEQLGLGLPQPDATDGNLVRTGAPASLSWPGALHGTIGEARMLVNMPPASPGELPRGMRLLSLAAGDNIRQEITSPYTQRPSPSGSLVWKRKVSHTQTSSAPSCSKRRRQRMQYARHLACRRQLSHPSRCEWPTL